MTDQVIVEVATVRDVDEISELIGEIEEYYGGEHKPGDASHIDAALFGDRPVATVLLARENGTVVGMASYSFLWPASGAESSLYLKELFVREPGRLKGIGRLLVEKLVEIAAKSGCSRMEWTADADNPAALAFYAALGVTRREDKLFFRMEM